MHEISIKAEELFRIGSFPITNALLLSLVTLVIVGVLALVIHLTLSWIPKKIQSIFEIVIEHILDLMESVLGSRAVAIRYFPLIATIFLFICLSNWLGLMPGVGSIGFV